MASSAQSLWLRCPQEHYLPVRSAHCLHSSHSVQGQLSNILAHATALSAIIMGTPVANEGCSILARQDRDLRQKKRWQDLTLRHLLLVRQAKITGEPVTFTDELVDWCEHVDDLSMLLWLALTVEGDGQSVMIP